MNNIISWSVILYIYTTYFYGIITKFTINNKILFSIKTVFPELLLLLIITVSLLKIIIKKSYVLKYKYLLFFIFYLFGIFAINFFTNPNIDEVFFVIRDLILPVIIFWSILQNDFTEKQLVKIIKRMNFIFIIFIMSGFVLAIIQRNMDWEWTSKFYTGYSFYGLDPYSKIKVWHTHGVLRVPSLTGNSVTFGVYNLIAFLFIWKSDIKKIVKISTLLISIGNIILSTSKTTMIALLVIVVIDIAIRLKGYIKFNVIILSLISFFIGLNIITYVNPNFLFSLSERLNYWKLSFSNIKLYNLLIPLNLFNTTAAAEGFMGFMDNSYLYFLYSIGLIGLIGILIIILKLYNKNAKYRYQLVLNYMVIIFIVYSMLVNITQGRAYFINFCILAPLLTKINRVIKE